MKLPIHKPGLALLAGAALFSTGAWAGPLAHEAVHTRTETVKYLPSQAATAEGAVALYDELKSAAHRVCSDPLPSPLRNHATEAEYASCVSDALGAAVRKVGIPMVTVLHQYGRQGRFPAVASR